MYGFASFSGWSTIRAPSTVTVSGLRKAERTAAVAAAGERRPTFRPAMRTFGGTVGGRGVVVVVRDVVVRTVVVVVGTVVVGVVVVVVIVVVGTVPEVVVVVSVGIVAVDVAPVVVGSVSATTTAENPPAHAKPATNKST
jgi:hypothetical protein